MNTPGTSTAEFFEAKYREALDPWEFSSSQYELDRYDRIITALEGRRYKNVYEPGCSIGVLTERLAGLSERILAVDFSPSASGKARERCRRFPGVVVKTAPVVEGLAAGGYDLIVLSEIGYYFSAESWKDIVLSLKAAMQPPGVVLAAHWLGDSRDHQLSGDVVHEILGASAGLPLDHSERHDKFRLDRWVYA